MNKMSLFDILAMAPTDQHRSIFEGTIMRKTMSRRIPMNVTVELTPLCNFSCNMCYARKDRCEVNALGGLLRHAEWMDLFRRCMAIGSFSFTLSGGECTLHPDFVQIYSDLYDLGAEITLMTNGSTIDESLIDLFKGRPPRKVYITVYGANEDTYGRMCHNRNGYQQVMRGIDSLTNIGLEVILQCTITQDNCEDVPQIYAFANSKKLLLRVNSTLLNYGNSTQLTIDEQAVTQDKLDSVYRKVIPEFTGTPDDDFDESKIEFISPENRGTGQGLQCNAARNSLHLTWKGVVQPCTTMDAFTIDPKQHDMKECWEQMVAWADAIPMYTECLECKYRIKCRHCTALHYNDTHEFGKPSPRLCYKIQHNIKD